VIMQTAHVHQARHFRRTGSLGSLALMLATSWWHEQRRRYRQRATARILHGLSDRALKDIGIDRSQIDSAVHSLGQARPDLRHP
jgi:uncharacterized protein YjiS (DUF1127 family)